MDISIQNPMENPMKLPQNCSQASSVGQKLTDFRTRAVQRPPAPAMQPPLKTWPVSCPGCWAKGGVKHGWNIQAGNCTNNVTIYTYYIHYKRVSFQMQIKYCMHMCMYIYLSKIYLYTILCHGNTVGIEWKYNDIMGGRITFHQNMGLNVDMNQPIWVLTWDTMIGCW